MKEKTFTEILKAFSPDEQRSSLNWKSKSRRVLPTLSRLVRQCNPLNKCCRNRGSKAASLPI